MVTVKEVAQLADVSPSTVSNVFNGHVPVRSKTRQRVLQAAKSLGYVPNTVARSLRHRKTRIVAFTIGDIANPSASFMVRGASDVFQTQGYHPLIFSCDEDPDQEQNVLTVAAGQRVAGLLMSPIIQDSQVYEWLQRVGIIVVCVDRRVPGLEVDVVRSDDILGFRIATEHLIKQGHQRVAIISGPIGSAVSTARIQGYCEALRRHDLPVEEALILEGMSKERFGYTALEQLVSMANPPTGTIIASTRLTLGVLYAMRDHNIQRPDQMALVGSVGRDLEWPSLFAPPLTVVSQPSRKIGAKAAELLIDRIAERRSGPGEEFLIAPELTVRSPQPVG